MDLNKLLARVQRQINVKRTSYVDKSTNSFKREPSKTERESTWIPLYLTRSCLFCIHRKLYFDVCAQCRRDKREAQLRYELFCKEHNIQP